MTGRPTASPSTASYWGRSFLFTIPIPAMSMVSHAAGARFVYLIGGTMLSFYDWYADLPPASPQIWGDQTDVPESADWYNSTYMIIWGSNLPMTRTPDVSWWKIVTGVPKLWRSGGKEEGLRPGAMIRFTLRPRLFQPLLRLST